MITTNGITRPVSAEAGWVAPSAVAGADAAGPFDAPADG
jgi:hypothetical protein